MLEFSTQRDNKSLYNPYNVHVKHNIHGSLVNITLYYMHYSFHFHLQILWYLWHLYRLLFLQSTSLGIGNSSPKLKDEVIGEPKCFQVRFVHSFSKFHCVLFLLTQLPYLRSCGKEKGFCFNKLRGKKLVINVLF